MAYEHETSHDLRRLIPLAASGFALTTLATVTFARPDEDLNGLGVMFVSLLMLCIGAQAIAGLVFTLGVSLMGFFGVAMDARFPALIGFSLLAGATLFWAVSPWIGAICGLTMLTAWLFSIRDLITEPEESVEARHYDSDELG